MYGKGRYLLFFEVTNFAVWRRSAKTKLIPSKISRYTVVRVKPYRDCLECDFCTKVCARETMCDHVFTVLAKRATFCTASGTQQQVSRCRPIYNLWRSRVEKSAFRVIIIILAFSYKVCVAVAYEVYLRSYCSLCLRLFVALNFLSTWWPRPRTWCLEFIAPDCHGHKFHCCCSIFSYSFFLRGYLVVLSFLRGLGHVPGALNSLHQVASTTLSSTLIYKSKDVPEWSDSDSLR